MNNASWYFRRNKPWSFVKPTRKNMHRNTGYCHLLVNGYKTQRMPIPGQLTGKLYLNYNRM
jgi:hypothetical protein